MVLTLMPNLQQCVNGTSTRIRGPREATVFDSNVCDIHNDGSQQYQPSRSPVGTYLRYVMQPKYNQSSGNLVAAGNEKICH